jgi:hypothetical protein
VLHSVTTQDYFAILYHDRFAQLVDELKSQLQRTDDGTVDLLNTISKGVDEGQVCVTVESVTIKSVTVTMFLCILVQVVLVLRFFQKLLFQSVG